MRWSLEGFDVVKEKGEKGGFEWTGPRAGTPDRETASYSPCYMWKCLSKFRTRYRTPHVARGLNLGLLGRNPSETLDPLGSGSDSESQGQTFYPLRRVREPCRAETLLFAYGSTVSKSGRGRRATTGPFTPGSTPVTPDPDRGVSPTNLRRTTETGPKGLFGPTQSLFRPDPPRPPPVLTCRTVVPVRLLWRGRTVGRRGDGGLGLRVGPLHLVTL